MNFFLTLANNLYEKINPLFPWGFSLFPRTATFELLYACNLHCSMCYLREEEVIKKIKAKKILTTDQVKKIINKIPSFTSISFTGGEPFLRKDIFKILNYAGRKHRIGIISNLVLLDEIRIKKLLETNIGALMFSIDGDQKTHDKIRGKGTYKKTVENVKRLIGLRNKANEKLPIITLNCVIQRDPMPVLNKVAQLAKELKVDICNFQVYDSSLNRSGYDLRNSLEHLDKKLIAKAPKITAKKLRAKLIEAKKILENSKTKLTFTPQFKIKQIINHYQQKINLNKAYCCQPYYSFRISPFGEVYPCFNLYVGNLLHQNFWKIWNSKKFRQFRTDIKKRKYLSSCLGCCHIKIKN